MGTHVPSGRDALAMRMWWVGLPPSPPNVPHCDRKDMWPGLAARTHRDWPGLSSRLLTGIGDQIFTLRNDGSNPFESTKFNASLPQLAEGAVLETVHVSVRIRGEVPNNGSVA